MRQAFITNAIANHYTIYASTIDVFETNFVIFILKTATVLRSLYLAYI